MLVSAPGFTVATREQGTRRQTGVGQDFAQASLAKDRDMRAERENLLVVGGNSHDSGAVGGQFAQKRMNFEFGADIDAARRFVQQQGARRAGDGAREHDLLLVAAAERSRLLRRAGRFQADARAHLKGFAHPGPMQSLVMIEVGSAEATATEAVVGHLLRGDDVGLMSEAGNPGVADPGALLVRAAHENGIRVVPLIGPSSIVMALAASGLGGQRFAFHGYLPADRAGRERALRHLEGESQRRDETEIFIETPHRNDALLETARNVLMPATRLCVAIDLTGPGESVRSATIAQWRERPGEIGRQPAIYLIAAPTSTTGTRRGRA